jgi:proteic killer suppression protein
MIKSIRHRGLRLLFEEGDRGRIRADLVAKAERFLDALDAASKPEDVALPGYRLHRLSGNLQGFWSAVLSRNHRIVFRFEAGDAYDVDLVDYH